MVLEDLLPSWVPENASENDNEAFLVEKEDIATPGLPEPDNYLPRDQLKITLKIFLHDFDVSSLLAAVQAALRKLSTNRVDSLFLATPVEAIPLLGIGSGAVGPDQQEATEHLLGLWRGVEQLIGEGKVGGAGLCDLHPPVFFSIYEQATVKPTSVQVNLKSCCVVPEELSSFAKSNRVTLLTHSDPGELLPGDCLRNMLYPKMAREASHYFETWVARYQVQLKDRGVLLQKRYLLELSK